MTRQVAAVSEAYAASFGIVRDDDWYLLKLQEEIGELTQSYLKLTRRARRQQGEDALDTAFAEELADVLCHALLAADHFGIDVTQTVEQKWLSKLEEAR